MLKWAVNTCGINICDASKMLSKTPSRVIGESRKGVIRRGADADIIFADRNLDIKRVFTGGREI